MINKIDQLSRNLLSASSNQPCRPSPAPWVGSRPLRAARRPLWRADCHSRKREQPARFLAQRSRAVSTHGQPALRAGAPSARLVGQRRGSGGRESAHAGASRQPRTRALHGNCPLGRARGARRIKYHGPKNHTDPHEVARIIFCRLS